MPTYVNGTTGASRVQKDSLTATVLADDAPVGKPGEYVSAQRLFSAPLAMTSTTPIGVISISLTAGDWDVQGQYGLVSAASTTVGSVAGYCDTTVSALDNDKLGITRMYYSNAVINTGGNGAPTSNTGVTRFSLAETTTVYLVAFAGFAVSTLSCFGTIHARRVR